MNLAKRLALVLIAVFTLTSTNALVVLAFTPGPQGNGFKVEAYSSSYAGSAGPLGLAFDIDGSLFTVATDGGLYKTPAGGGTATLVGTVGSNPSGLAFGRGGNGSPVVANDGRLYAALKGTYLGSSGSTGSVVELDKTNGAILRTVASDPHPSPPGTRGSLACPDGLASDPVGGDLFVTSYCHTQIYRVKNPAPGTSVAATSKFAFVSGQVASHAISITPGGTILITDVLGKAQSCPATTSSGGSSCTIMFGPGSWVGAPAFAGISYVGIENTQGVDDPLYIFANARDSGAIYKVGHRSPGARVIASDAGGRGDFMIIGPDNCLYSSNGPSVFRTSKDSAPDCDLLVAGETVPVLTISGGWTSGPKPQVGTTWTITSMLTGVQPENGSAPSLTPTFTVTGANSQTSSLAGISGGVPSWDATSSGYTYTWTYTYTGLVIGNDHVAVSVVANGFPLAADNQLVPWIAAINTAPPVILPHVIPPATQGGIPYACDESAVEPHCGWFVGYPKLWFEIIGPDANTPAYPVPGSDCFGQANSPANAWVLNFPSPLAGIPKVCLATTDAGTTVSKTVVLQVADPPSITPTLKTADGQIYIPGTHTQQDIKVAFTCTANPVGYSCSDGITSVSAPIVSAPDAPTVYGRPIVQNAVDVTTEGISSRSGFVKEAGDPTADPSSTLFQAGPGRTVTSTVENLIIDRTAPLVTPTSSYVAGTWTRQLVTVSYVCDDTTTGNSGITACAVTPGANYTVGSDPKVATIDTPAGTSLIVLAVPATGRDGSLDALQLGNLGNGTFGPIKIDKVAPVITATATSNGLPYDLIAHPPTTHPVIVTFTCVDPDAPAGGSGVATCPSPVTLSSPTDTATVTSTDQVGNVSAAFVVGPLPVVTPTSLVVTGGTFVYDDTGHVGVPTLTGGPSGATITVTYAYTAPGTLTPVPFVGTPTNAGVYAITATYAGDGNYAAATATNTITITQITPVLTWPAIDPITLGTPLSGTQLNTTAAGLGGVSLPGVFMYTPGTGTVLPAGSNPLAVSFVPTDTINYTAPVTKTNTITVLAAATTVIVADLTLIYDGSGHPTTAEVKDTSNVAIPGATVTWTYTYTAPGSTTPVPFVGTPTNAGVYTATATYAGDASHLGSTGAGTITINPAPTTISAPDVTAVYNGGPRTVVTTVVRTGTTTPVITVPAATVVYTPQAGSPALIAAKPQDVGVYDAALSYAGDTNYLPSTGTARVTITPLTLVITAASIVVTYDGLGHPVTVVVKDSSGNVITGLTPTIVYTGGQPLVAGQPVGAGVYNVTVSLAASGNYNAASTTATVTINKAPSTTTLTGGTFTYDAAPHPATNVLIKSGANLIPGATATVVYTPAASLTAGLPQNVGTYTATATYAGDANYLGSSGTATITIVQAGTPITAKALVDHECDTTEWHFVITKTSRSQAPAYVVVVWANGQTANVPLEKVTGGTAHYRTTLNLNSSVTSATANVVGNWGGQFNLSHGPCGTGNTGGGGSGGSSSCPTDVDDRITNVSFKLVGTTGTRTVTDLLDKVKEGDTVTANFTIAAGCSNVEVSLVSYKAPEPEYSESQASLQVVSQQATGTFNAGARTLTVSVPNCFFQVDFVRGPVITQLGPEGSNNFYGAQDRLLSYDNGGMHMCSDLGTGANFVIWGGQKSTLSASTASLIGKHVQFWGDQWAKQVLSTDTRVGNYDAHNDFKGWGGVVSGSGSNAKWTTKPGQTTQPSAVGKYVTVIITNDTDKDGSWDKGNIIGYAVIRVDNGGAATDSPGHKGWGTVISVSAP